MEIRRTPFKLPPDLLERMGLSSQPQVRIQLHRKSNRTMIHFSLGMTPESTIALNDLRQKALPAVINELANCGYTVNHADMATEPLDHINVNYRLEPGPATLTMVTKGDVLGGIEFHLDGKKFGMAGRLPDNDPLIWMRLVQLGLLLGQTYKLAPEVSDPDMASEAG
jgi:hypothetical protein